MSPVEAQACWSLFPRAQAQEGAKGTTHGCYITTGGVLHTHLVHFHLFLGWGWTLVPVNANTATLTEPSHDSLSPPLRYLLSMGLTACPTATQTPTLGFVSVGPKMKGISTGSTMTSLFFPPNNPPWNAISRTLNQTVPTVVAQRELCVFTWTMVGVTVLFISVPWDELLKSTEF